MICSRNVDSRIEHALQLLTQRMAEPHTISSLAQAVNLSSSRLAHLFKVQVGDSPIETLLKLRLRQAARLLQFTTRHIGEIAFDVGFQSSYYFSRQFRACYGMSPRAYRESRQHN